VNKGQDPALSQKELLASPSLKKSAILQISAAHALVPGLFASHDRLARGQSAFALFLDDGEKGRKVPKIPCLFPERRKEIATKASKAAARARSQEAKERRRRNQKS
jgi:hypothetical protein